MKQSELAEKVAKAFVDIREHITKARKRTEERKIDINEYNKIIPIVAKKYGISEKKIRTVGCFNGESILELELEFD